MIYNETPLKDVFLIDIEKRGDDRGFFARVMCEDEMTNAGLESRFVQVNSSLSAKRGTLRGLHYQLAPSAEVKVARCIRGELWDVVLDLRPDSPTYQKWFGAFLSAENRRMMYVPRGFAHGFITVTENVEAFYFVSAFYAPEQERGIRWNDPQFSIKWPFQPDEISTKDSSWPDFNEVFHGVGTLRGIR